MFTSLLFILLVLICGLCNRFAGGLLSQWVGKDLGDFKPRLIWGCASAISAAIISIIVKPSLASEWYFWLSVVLVAILTTVARGFGWGDSMSVGFQKDSDNEHSTFYAQTAIKEDPMFVLRSMSMTIFVMSLQAFLHDTTVLNAIIAVILSTVFTGVVWLGAYTLAFLKPLNIPKLGMLNNTQIDPPPTGEFYCGMLLIVNFIIFAYI